MNGSVLLILSIVLFAAAYKFYGKYLSKIFKIKGSTTTPAHKMNDGIDYVPTKTAVLFGHHFASIAGARPIVGPVIACYLGRGLAVIWIIAGSIFVGAFHDFASMIISVRNDGRSIAFIIEGYLGYTGRQMFLLFCWAALVLVVAIFSILVAKICVNSPSAATASILFIIIAPIFGYLQYKKNMSITVGSFIFVPLLFISIWTGVVFPLNLNSLFGISAGNVYSAWVILLLAYSFAASVLPVWLLLQPRDYLNSYLLYLT